MFPAGRWTLPVDNVHSRGYGGRFFDPINGNLYLETGSFFPFFSHKFLRFSRCEYVLTSSGSLVGPETFAKRGARALFPKPESKL